MTMKRLATTVLTVYLLGYLALRVMNTEVWDKDGQTYVIFPQDTAVLYYAYRPLTYLDGALTGMRFHIGPHR
jgi:hypothetical protein